MHNQQYSGKTALQGGKKGGGNTTKQNRDTLICSVYWFLWYKYSHHGRFQANNSWVTYLQSYYWLL